MIRALALILGLSLGLCLAVLVGGTMAHLRLVAEWTGRALPIWTGGIDPDAGVARGQGVLNGAALRWNFTGREGFAVSLSGPDWQAQGQAVPEGATLAIGDLSGILPLEWLDAGHGVMVLDAGEVRLGLDGSLHTGQIEGQARGSDPEGPVTLTWQDGWVLVAR